MFSPTVRWLLVFASMGFGIRALWMGQWAGGLLCVSAVLLAVGHFLYGSVRASFTALKQGKLKRAHQLWSRTPTRFLTAESRAYYHWIAAALAEARKDLDTACVELRKALEYPLRSDKDRVLARATLAAILERRGLRDEALAEVEIAESLNPSAQVRPLLDALRSKLE